MFELDRRGLLTGMGSLTLFGVGIEVFAAEEIREINELKPGNFTWHPDRQPVGPVAIVVSLPEQLVHVYRNGVRIAVSTCSSGKAGHETPTGVFVILQKDKHHHSSTYNNAPMPNMNRLTWSGVALHAGNLPGYPASHGCVRLPIQFSEKLFSITHLGTPVIIAGSHSDPWDVTHPGMILSGYAESEFKSVEASLDSKKHPKDWAESEVGPITSMIASSADKRIILIENGEILAEGKLDLRGADPLGSHAFVLNGPNESVKGMHWTAISHRKADSNAFASDDQVLLRLSAENAFIEQMKAKLHPGMVLILTDAPLHPDARTGRDFVIMS